jgi:hypothetical protein
MRFGLLLAVVPAAIAAPLLTPRVGTVIKDKYIVKFKNDILMTTVNTVLDILPKPPSHVYSSDAFLGFAGFLDSVSLQLVLALQMVGVF